MIKQIMLATLLFPLMSFADVCASVPVEFSDAYALTTSVNDEQLEVFITVKNLDPLHEHTLSSVSSPGARLAVFQAYARHSDDTNTTGVSDQVVIPPKGLFIFRPRNLHIVLNGYKDRPNPDDMISLTFTFADDCTQTVNNIPVKSPD
ncbi:MAG: copper chaperone PCu(A)C [Gammaproteobacteria bacterium]